MSVLSFITFFRWNMIRCACLFLSLCKFQRKIRESSENTSLFLNKTKEKNRLHRDYKSASNFTLMIILSFLQTTIVNLFHYSRYILVCAR